MPNTTNLPDAKRWEDSQAENPVAVEIMDPSWWPMGSDGVAAVLDMEDGCRDGMHLSPQQCREIAAELIRLADKAEK